jgi:hypothetical protein
MPVSASVTLVIAFRSRAERLHSFLNAMRFHSEAFPGAFTAGVVATALQRWSYD